MKDNEIEWEGEVFIWSPTVINGKPSPDLFVIDWLKGGNPDQKVFLGKAKRWSGGRGWVLTPRIGGRTRATEQGMGVGTTKVQACSRLFRLAQSEPQLSVYDKARLGIIRDDGSGPVDTSAKLEQVAPSDTLSSAMKP